MQEADELLECVDETGEPTGEYVNRKEFYEGKCPNKRICGVVFWIFDKEGNLLLAERGTEKEQGAGKISPPSGHVQYGRTKKEEERPIQACFSETEEELGIAWDYENFVFTDDYYPIGIIDRPKGSAENCEMLVKHYALLLNDGVKEKIKANEAKRIFFESWESAAPKFGIDDNTAGTYQFFGTNKTAILAELEKFNSKITDLSKLGEGATWDTIALFDDDTFEKYRQASKLRPEDREGYVTWKMMSTRDDLWTSDEECTVCDTITTREDVSQNTIEWLLYKYAKNVRTRREVERAKPITRQHTIQEFSEITAPQSEVNRAVRTLREVKKIKGQVVEDSFLLDY